MITSNRHSRIILALLVLVPILAGFHLLSGPISISKATIWDAFFNYDENDGQQIVIRILRFPRMIMAMLSGAGLAIAGLLMQTLFNNPLAGPYVLGINSGASLFVAFSIMTGIPFFTSDLGIITNALLGAFVFGMLILGFSRYVKSHISLLLIGLMLGNFTSAFVSILQTASEAQELKLFALWSMGSLQKVELEQLALISIVFLIGLVSALFIVKPLNILITGESNAKLMGIHIYRIRIIIILITALFTGLITAFCGPIAFVGLAVPNIVRIIFKTQNHFTLIVASSLIGALFILTSDLLIQLLEPYFLIPINALTSIIGAPIVVFIVLNRLR